MITLPPQPSAVKISHSDTSNASALISGTASNRAVPSTRCAQQTMLTKLRCSRMTPFGPPVDPEVKRITAALAEMTGDSARPAG